MRQIIFDTETTGMNFNAPDKSEGHRIIELGCVELIDRKPTGRTLHLHFNPEQQVDEQAVNVHGMDNAFLADKPLFKDKLNEIEAYFQGADELIAHNMPFDQAFLNRELTLAGRNYRLEERFKLTDTVIIARKMFPGARNSLDALCKRFNVDNSGREKHGALLDSELLLEVYLKLTGGQSTLFESNSLTSSQAHSSTASQKNITKNNKNSQSLWQRVIINEQERAAHQAILEKIRS
ncbi:DNA polymerase III subunit epsilon [Suttonella ornithocola]|uniref:DNA polymerase III subunit epsilon n=1 Tax=Suttonella ornithocola TaxID=279832 RepID=A0A380MTH8_9GAMM|nr:DNA polymerase III subunit epsilon [Suttonella ornithocola]SUO95582.1 DNA polymerase III subunit epsilon [Suttonella ornithocola]